MPDSGRYWLIPIADPIIGATLIKTYMGFVLILQCIEREREREKERVLESQSYSASTSSCVMIGTSGRLVDESLVSGGKWVGLGDLEPRPPSSASGLPITTKS